MERQDYIWVGIRLFGVFLLVEAVLAIPGLLAASVLVYRRLVVTETFPFPSNEFFTVTLGQLVQSLSAVAIYGLVGLYLIRGGRRVFRWISPPPEPGA
jgi:hypothetical protein